MLEIAPRYKFISEKQIITLVIFELTPEDAGMYEVRVSNNAGISRSTAKITLRKPDQPKPTASPAESAPQIVEPLKPMSIDEGRSTTLQCTITGSPGTLMDAAVGMLKVCAAKSWPRFSELRCKGDNLLPNIPFIIGVQLSMSMK